MGYVEAEFCGGAEKGKDIKGWFGKVNFMLWMTDDLKNEYYFFQQVCQQFGLLWIITQYLCFGW